jgi:hypothetical protein
VSDLRASIGRSSASELEVAFRLTGVVSRIRLPAPGAARSGSRLWEHTCFELFVARERESAYCELNFAPSREWALYAFSDYRRAAGAPRELKPPEISVRKSDDVFELGARISLREQFPCAEATRWRIGLSAVVETSEGRRSYWALRHPREKPDFHHPDAFALWLEPPVAGS